MNQTQKKQKERRQALVKALRSGKYKQAKRQLGKVVKGKESYCCLGVACEVAIQLGLKLKKQIEDDTICYDGYEMRVLPDKVQKFYGFSDSSGNFDDFNHTSSLTYKNDDGKKFTTIAKIIEEEPGTLVK